MHYINYTNIITVFAPSTALGEKGALKRGLTSRAYEIIKQPEKTFYH